MTSLRLVVLCALLSVSAEAFAQQRPAPRRATGGGVGGAGPRLNPAQQREAQRRAEERAIAARVNKERRDRVRASGSRFRSIAVDRQTAGEYVVARNNKVTAFLDVTDPLHPGFNPARETDEEDLAAIPIQRRAHILVVPNVPREHLTGVLGRSIEGGDLETSLEVVNEAKKLARELGIKNPRVFINAESRVGIGYLHVHIVGERPPNRPYPPPLQ